MGSSSIIATRKRQVYMAHICSKCQFPTVSLVVIEAKAEKTYSFFESKAEHIANETANNAIEYEIKRIENCRHTKKVLTEKEKGRSIAWGHYCSSSIFGFDNPCPNCKNIEPWQRQNDSTLDYSKIITELKDVNFPLVFKEKGKITQWINSSVSSLRQEIEKKRQNKILVEQAAIKTINSAKKLKKIKEQLESIPELKDRDSVNDHMRKYYDYKEQLGILDFKVRNLVNSTIEEDKIKLENLNKIIADKKQAIKFNIDFEQETLIYNQSVAFGCTEKIMTVEFANTVNYYYAPNDIPKELFSTIDENEKTNEKELAVELEIEESIDTEFGKHKPAIFCRKCGFKLLQNSVFCSKCGIKID